MLFLCFKKLQIKRNKKLTSKFYFTNKAICFIFRILYIIIYKIKNELKLNRFFY